jgi:hypothetical protein
LNTKTSTGGTNLKEISKNVIAKFLLTHIRVVSPDGLPQLLQQLYR